VGITEATQAATTWSIRVLGIIPAATLTSPEITLEISGSHIGLPEICRKAIDRDPLLAAPYLAALATLSSTTQEGMLVVTNSLLTGLATLDHPNEQQIEHTLLYFLSNHAYCLELLNSIAQITRYWSTEFIQDSAMRTACVTRARQGLTQIFDSLDGNVTDDVRRCALVLIRALESPALREAASSSLEITLRGTHPNLAPQRRALAGNVLQALRHIPEQSELRRLAALVFTTGDILSAPAGLPVRSERCAATTADARGAQGGVLERLCGIEGSKYAERLTPTDFQHLRQLTGLSLDAFRAITERIRLRATTESWARAATLDLARAPHAPEVTTSIRTATLGALVNEARRLGRLSSQIEKEIFAVSAEIPTLTHLTERDLLDEDKQL
jgi:hypothetical protein